MSEKITPTGFMVSGWNFDTMEQAESAVVRLHQESRVDNYLGPLATDASRGDKSKRSRRRKVLLEFVIWLDAQERAAMKSEPQEELSEAPVG